MNDRSYWFQDETCQFDEILYFEAIKNMKNNK